MKLKILALLALTAMITHGLAVAQELQKEPQGYRLEGRDIPRYYLIKHFFPSAHTACVVEVDFCEFFLRELGLSNSSRDALARAVARSRELEYGKFGPRVYVDEEAGVRKEMGRGNSLPHPETFASEEEYMQVVAEFEDEKARSLADIWADFIEEVEAAGDLMTGVDRYIDERIADSTSTVSDEPFEDPQHAIWRTSAAFNARLRSRAAQAND